MALLDLAQQAAPTNGLEALGTRYGVWDGDSYKAVLPWGLYTYTIGGQAGPLQAIAMGSRNPHAPRLGGDGEADVGLFWDSRTGQVVGGDQQLDQFRSLWTGGPGMLDLPDTRAPGQPTQMGTKTSGGWGRYWAEQGSPIPSYGATEMGGYPVSEIPFWWESAHNPDFRHTATRSEGPDGFTWNFPEPLAPNVQFPRTAGEIKATYGAVAPDFPLPPNNQPPAANPPPLSSGSGGGGGGNYTPPPHVPPLSSGSGGGSGGNYMPPPLSSGTGGGQGGGFGIGSVLGGSGGRFGRGRNGSNFGTSRGRPGGVGSVLGSNPTPMSSGSGGGRGGGGFSPLMPLNDQWRRRRG
jgi:hypothetical protein